MLKPEWMLPGLLSKDAQSAVVNPLPQRKPRTLCVSVFSAHATQHSVLCWKDDLYVEVSGEGRGGMCWVCWVLGALLRAVRWQ